MHKFKAWLIDRYLPAYCRDALKEENAQLRKAIAEQRREIDQLDAYIRGAERALRYQKRVTIQTGGDGD